MKKALVILALGTFLPLAGQAAFQQQWATGVSERSGWVDFNKTAADTRDNELCWAAAASNIINWRQRQYEIPNGVPQEDAIWETVKSSFVDKGGMAANAFSWWIDGSGGVDVKNFDVGGFYRKPWRPVGPYASNYVKYTPASSYAGASDDLINFLRDGKGVTISLSRQHELTLWGVEYDTSSNLITKMWLTDSDDKETRLIPVRCFEMEGMLGIYKEDYTFLGEEVHVFAYSTLAPMDDFLTPIPTPPIPEPSAFGLLAGIVALVLAGTRRSRRKRNH